MIEIPKLMMVCDVESVGLHGEGFAVGYVVINDSGKELGSAMIACLSENASGSQDDRKWVDENIPLLITPLFYDTPLKVRQNFWSSWLAWKNNGAKLFAECLWPVEARFLCACVNDGHARDFEGPYPFHEIASIMLAAGMDPMTSYPRLANELPAHNPLADARQSSRLLMEAFGKLNQSDRYNELIMAVARKFPGESRHDTALRYIQQAEHNASTGSDQSENAKTS